MFWSERTLHIAGGIVIAGELLRKGRRMHLAKALPPPEAITDCP